jgi:hypothetical protein
MHDQIASQFGVADDLPCADSAFLAPLKRSSEFKNLRSRLAGPAPHPVWDSWLDDGFHFFVFQLAPSEGRTVATAGLAVFAMHSSQHEPISAVTVVPTDDGRQAEITNLMGEGGSYLAPLPEDPATS